jgi:hypothetical protein
MIRATVTGKNSCAPSGFVGQSDAERVIDWLRDGILKSGCVWDLEAEALEQPEGTYRIAAALTKGGQMYRIG